MAQAKKKITTPTKSATASKAADTSTKATKGAKAGTTTPAPEKASKKATTATKKAAAPPVAPPAPTYKTYLKKDIVANVLGRLSSDQDLVGLIQRSISDQVNALSQAASTLASKEAMSTSVAEKLNALTAAQEKAPMKLIKMLSEQAINALITEWESILLQGDKIWWSDWGVMGTRERVATTAMNPRTKEKIEVPAKKVFYFKAASKLKNQLQHGVEGQKAAQA